MDTGGAHALSRPLVLGAALFFLSSCSPSERETIDTVARIRTMTSAEKIQRATQILQSIPVGGYCRETPQLSEALRVENCCGFLRKNESLGGTTYSTDVNGEIAEIRYECVGLDGANYFAAIGVDLETGAIMPVYSDPDARHLNYVIRRLLPRELKKRAAA